MTAAELDEIPGIGPPLANAFLEYKAENGDFEKMDDLLNVSGIGESKLAGMKEYFGL